MGLFSISIIIIFGSMGYASPLTTILYILDSERHEFLLIEIVLAFHRAETDGDEDDEEETDKADEGNPPGFDQEIVRGGLGQVVVATVSCKRKKEIPT